MLAARFDGDRRIVRPLTIEPGVRQRWWRIRDIRQANAASHVKINAEIFRGCDL